MRRSIRCSLFRCILALIGLALATAAPGTAFGQELEEFDASYVESTDDGARLAKADRRIVALTNRFRSEQGRKAVSRDAKLTKAAEYFAAYMSRTGEYGHLADGNRPSQRVSLHGYDYCLVAENIAFLEDPAGPSAEQLAERIVDGWKESEEHRRNLLDPNMTEIGVAVGQDPESGRYYAVQVFARPKSAAIRFQAVNKTSEPLSYRLEMGRDRSPEENTFELPVRGVRTHLVCRPTKIAFTGVSGRGEIEAKAGHRYVAEMVDGAIQIDVEASSQAETSQQ